MMSKIIVCLVSMMVLGGGITMLYFGVKWEIDYKRGFDGKTRGKIMSVNPSQNNVCLVSYMYTVNDKPYTGVAKRDCLFTLLTDTEVAYRTKFPHCSRLSTIHTSNDDLSTCDDWKTRAKRHVMITFGCTFVIFAFLLVIYGISSKEKISPSNDVELAAKL